MDTTMIQSAEYGNGPELVCVNWSEGMYVCV